MRKRVGFIILSLFIIGLSFLAVPLLVSSESYEGDITISLGQRVKVGRDGFHSLYIRYCGMISDDIGVIVENTESAARSHYGYNEKYVKQGLIVQMFHKYFLVKELTAQRIVLTEVGG